MWQFSRFTKHKVIKNVCGCAWLSAMFQYLKKIYSIANTSNCVYWSLWSSGVLIKHATSLPNDLTSSWTRKQRQRMWSVYNTISNNSFHLKWRHISCKPFKRIQWRYLANKAESKLSCLNKCDFIMIPDLTNGICSPPDSRIRYPVTVLEDLAITSQSTQV